MSLGQGNWKPSIGLAALAASVATLALSATASAQIQGDPNADRLVTIAARECDSYQDIRANLARNNLMESLQDLGADTLYVSGDPVDPRSATSTAIPSPGGRSPAP
jgi:hypothetical protein